MKELQETVKRFCAEHNINLQPEIRMLDLTSEVGELAKEILKASNYGKKQLEFREEMKLELGDVLFSLITLANALGINLEEALNSLIEKYRARASKGSIGSEFQA